MIQKMYNKLFENGLSPKTVINIHRTLKLILDHAVKSGYLIKNVAEAVKLPKYEKQERSTLTEDEYILLLRNLQNETYGLVFEIASTTGMRLGEILALTWDCVDFDNKTIEIKQSLRRVKIFNKDGTTKTELVFQTPKTVSSIRKISIGDHLKNRLIEHKKHQNEEKSKKCDDYNSKNLVFCNSKGKPIETSTIERKWKSIKKKYNIDEKIRIHDLRHTYATYLSINNINPKIIQQSLGHTRIETTLNIYSHLNINSLKAKKRKNRASIRRSSNQRYIIVYLLQYHLYKAIDIATAYGFIA